MIIKLGVRLSTFLEIDKSLIFIYLLKTGKTDKTDIEELMSRI